MLRIIQTLKDEGVHAGDKVAIELPPGAELIASILAIQFIGAAYVPIDRNAPVARNILILNDSQPRMIINERSFKLCRLSGKKHIPDVVCLCYGGFITEYGRSGRIGIYYLYFGHDR